MGLFYRKGSIVTLTRKEFEDVVKNPEEVSDEDIRNLILKHHPNMVFPENSDNIHIHYAIRPDSVEVFVVDKKSLVRVDKPES